MTSSVGGNPFPVAVAPDIPAAQGAVHIVVEPGLFQGVVGLYLDAGEKAVPGIHIVFPDGFEVPTEWPGDLCLKVLGGIFHADQRDSGTDLDRRGFGRIELRIQPSRTAAAPVERRNILAYGSV